MFHPATKEGTRLRCAVFGPSGSGKTYSALRIATGLGGRIAVIDTERRTARKYADRFTFDVCDLQNRTIEGYCAAIDAASGYDVLIIDSLSHAWEELLAEVDRLAKAKYRGNKWAAWSEGTPRQKHFLDRLLASPCHVLATLRTATEWQTSDESGKGRPVRVGLKPEQGKGIEYEFDLLLELSVDHIAQVIKDRSDRFQDQTIDRPGEQFGAELAAWLKDGGPLPARPAPTPPASPPSPTKQATPSAPRY